jgi:hypothetical protein
MLGTQPAYRSLNYLLNAVTDQLARCSYSHFLMKIKLREVKKLAQEHRAIRAEYGSQFSSVGLHYHFPAASRST